MDLEDQSPFANVTTQGVLNVKRCLEGDKINSTSLLIYSELRAEEEHPFPYNHFASIRVKSNFNLKIFRKNVQIN